MKTTCPQCQMSLTHIGGHKYQCDHCSSPDSTCSIAECEICYTVPDPDLGCKCNQLLKRIEKQIGLVESLKEHAVEIQEFTVAEQCRDAAKSLTFAVYKLKIAPRSKPLVE